MSDETPAQQDITYPHPGELDLDPVDVGRAAAQQLREASAATGAHAVAVARQVRSSYLSQQLADEPTATPEDLAAAWKRCREARLTAQLLRNASAFKSAAQALAEHLERA